MDDDIVIVGNNRSGRITRSMSKNKLTVDNITISNKRRTSKKRRKSNRNVQQEKNNEIRPVDVIDLVNTPTSDTKDKQSNNKKNKGLVDDWLSISLDTEEEDEEQFDEVKAIWCDAMAKIERFSLKKTDPLVPIFEHFAKLNNVDKDCINIQTNDYKRIHQYDSISTLKLKVTNFLIASLKNSNENKQEDINNLYDENMIVIKCQVKDRKQPLLCRIHCNEPFSSLAKQCASKLECNMDKVKLYFDGDAISMDETPLNLEFDGGECVDVKIL